MLSEMMACEESVAEGMCAWKRLASAEVSPVSDCRCWGNSASDGCANGFDAMVGDYRRVPWDCRASGVVWQLPTLLREDGRFLLGVGGRR